MAIALNVNGATRTVDVESDTPLLWVLRDELRLTGTKFGCGIAQCGACTVHVDGQPVRACVTPVSLVAGKRIVTIEGLAGPEAEAVRNADQAMVAAYRAGIEWEDADDLLLRAGKLTAALLIARVEGKSPAPYLTDPGHKRIVRDQARALILAPTPIDALVANWKRNLA